MGNTIKAQDGYSYGPKLVPDKKEPQSTAGKKIIKMDEHPLVKEKHSDYFTASKPVSKPADDGPSIPAFMVQRSRARQYAQATEYRNSDGDSFTTTRQKRPQTSKTSSARRTSPRENAASKKQNATNPIKSKIIGLALASLIGGGAYGVTNALPPSQPDANFDTNNYSLVEIADMTGIDESAIILANGVAIQDEMPDEIVLPQTYTYYGDQIEKLEYSIEFDKLTQKDREDLIAELDEIKEAQAKLDEIATVYVDEDEKWAYIIPNGHVSSETLKDAFGIKDGVIKDYNGSKLSYTWETDNPEYGYYRDYTGSSIPSGGIKIPLKELGKELD